MNKFELDYNGEKIYAEPKSGGYYIKLPDRGDGKSIYEEQIFISDDACLAFTTDKNDPKYFLKIALRQDGIIEYRDNLMPKKELTIYDPNYQIDKFPYNVAKTMQNLQVQLQHLTRIQAEVNNLRRKKLDLVLKKLGYKSPEDVFLPLEDYSGVCNLSEIAEDLENYEPLIEIEGFSERKGDDIIYKMPTKETKLGFMQVLQRNVDKQEMDEKALAEEEEMLDRKRFLPGRITDGYAKEIPSKICMNDYEWKDYTKQITEKARDVLDPKNDKKLPKFKPSISLHNRAWRKYSEQVNKLAMLYLGLNADLLDEKTSLRVKNLTGLSRLEIGDEASKMFDETLDYDEAAYIENVFKCAENIEFLEILDALIEENEEMQSSGLGESTRELREHSKKEIADR